MISGSCQQAALLSAPQLWWAHRTYLCLSRRRAGSEVHIPVSCHCRIKRNLNRSSSLPTVLTQREHTAASLGTLSSTTNPGLLRVDYCPCTELGKEEQGRWPKGLHPSCPMPTSSPAGLSEVSTFLLCPPILPSPKWVGRGVSRE